MATGNNQEESVRIMKEGMGKSKKEENSEPLLNGDVATKDEPQFPKVELVPWEQEYPNGLGTFDLILKELRRTNSLLTQIRNNAMGIPMSQENNEITKTNR
jgi:hypothetical protein